MGLYLLIKPTLYRYGMLNGLVLLGFRKKFAR